MSKKQAKWTGKIDELPSKTIYINVGHLEKGNYQLNVVHKNKLIVKTVFRKN